MFQKLIGVSDSSNITINKLVRRVIYIKHLFIATIIGHAKEREGIWFDSNFYTKEEAESEFKPYQGVTQRGYDYTGYEYGGKKYHHYSYLGEFDEDKLPKNIYEYLDTL